MVVIEMALAIHADIVYSYIRTVTLTQSCYYENILLPLNLGSFIDLFTGWVEHGQRIARIGF